MEEKISFRKNGTINVVLHKNDLQAKPTTPVTKPQQTFEVNEEEHAPLKRLEEQLNMLVGLEHVKYIMKEIYALLYMNKKRSEYHLKDEKQVLHMLFKGNPGTGKTTIARLIGKMFYEMKILSKGHLVEVERADLVGEYIGHTAIKTRDLLKRAMGGILFIDEAYSLGRGGEKDFGKEAIDTLVAHMENRQHDFILIIAGYSKEMDRFLQLNPGLRSRFPFLVDFPDYNVDQLLQIAKMMYGDREYTLTNEAEIKLRNHLQILAGQNNSLNFSNGRYIRNIVERSIRKQAIRLLHEKPLTKEKLIELTYNDLQFDDVQK